MNWIQRKLANFCKKYYKDDVWEKVIRNMGNKEIKRIEKFDALIRYCGKENLQSFLDYQDTLNVISVR